MQPNTYVFLEPGETLFLMHRPNGNDTQVVKVEVNDNGIGLTTYEELCENKVLNLTCTNKDLLTAYREENEAKLRGETPTAY